MKILTQKFIPLSLLPFLSGCLVQADEWQDLFNGKDLAGWEIRSWSEQPGSADYHIEDGSIVGVSKLGVPNTFLCTEKTYGDFILEFDVLVDVGLNSGVQIRSLSDPAYQSGRVHGYQAEIDTAIRAWSGGIFDEKRRGWLYPLSRNEKGRRAFRNGEWNHYRIEAIGSEIRTWVNGVQCANLVDDMTSEGFIGLQVHSISNPRQKGLTVKWKNIKILTDHPAEHRMPLDPDVPVVNWMTNKLSDQEKREGWRFLWDGKTTNGWRRANDTVFPEEGWIVEDGILTVLESGGGESRNGGDIVTLEEFSNFELELDFMITPGANSGIKYFVIEGLNKGVGSAIGLEYQILDDNLHPDAKEGVMGNRTVGSLYDLLTARNLSEPDRDDAKFNWPASWDEGKIGKTLSALGSSKRFNAPGKWNKARLIVRGDRVEHWLNNLKVIEYDRGSQLYRNLVRKSKYAKFEGFGEAAAGHLLLQDHGNRVSFRSIKVREF
jgi:hypothetical protein